MTSHLAWYVARTSGMLAWCLMSAAVIWGLLLSTRLMNRRPSPKWLLDLHRFLGGLAVTFTVIHVAGLVGDNYLHFGRADVLVPFASQWRPTAVALGVVSLWLLAAVEVTSLLMRYLPRRRWHQVHLASYAVFWSATLHTAAGRHRHAERHLHVHDLRSDRRRRVPFRAPGVAAEEARARRRTSSGCGERPSGPGTFGTGALTPIRGVW